MVLVDPLRRSATLSEAPANFCSPFCSPVPAAHPTFAAKRRIPVYQRFRELSEAVGDF
jgi:hypothetical protein